LSYFGQQGKKKKGMENGGSEMDEDREQDRKNRNCGQTKRNSSE